MAGSRKVAYVFSNEKDLDNAIIAGRNSASIVLGGGRSAPMRSRSMFAKVDSGESGFLVKATEVVWDSSLNGGDGDWASPEGTAWRFDSDSLDEDYVTTSLQSTTSLSEDDVVEVMLYGDKSATTQWLARPGGQGGSSSVLLSLKSFSSGVYTADIITSPTDSTALTEDVKAKLLEGASNESTLVGDKVFSSGSYTETIDASEQTVYYFSHPVIK